MQERLSLNKQTKDGLLWGIGGGIIAGILQSYRPFASTVIPIAKEDLLLWWIDTVFIIITGVFIATGVYVYWYWQKKDVILARIATIGLIIALVHELIAVGYVAVKIYLLWKGSPVARYFLPPYSQYYFLIIWRYAQPYGFAIVAGVLGVILFAWLKKVSRNRITGGSEIIIVAWMGVVLGWERMFTAIFVAMILAAVIMFTTRKSSTRLTPGLLLSFLAAMFY